MNFNRHYDLQGQHAFLSASKHSWINYDLAKVENSYSKFLATQRGTELHDFARRCIDLRVRLPKNKLSLNCYVNDALGYRMKPEIPLVYSSNAFGTVDTISFREKLLRIHDLKTGISPVSMDQPKIYAALFCLEYDELPKNIEIELRIYQNDEIVIYKPEPTEILDIMKKIVEFDKRIEELKLEKED